MQPDQPNDEFPNPYTPTGLQKELSEASDNGNKSRFNWTVASIFGYVMSVGFAVGWTNQFVLIGSMIMLGLLVGAWLAASCLYRICYGPEES